MQVIIPAVSTSLHCRLCRFPVSHPGPASFGRSESRTAVRQSNHLCLVVSGLRLKRKFIFQVPSHKCYVKLLCQNRRPKGHRHRSCFLPSVGLDRLEGLTLDRLNHGGSEVEVLVAPGLAQGIVHPFGGSNLLTPQGGKRKLRWGLFGGCPLGGKGEGKQSISGGPELKQTRNLSSIGVPVNKLQFIATLFSL